MKPDVIYTLPEALQQIASLHQVQADLSDNLTQERAVFTRIIQELTIGNATLKEEKQQVTRWLAAEQERGIDKDRQITASQQDNEQLRQQLADLQ